MMAWAMVALGGALGATLRYGAGRAVAMGWTAVGFPVATLLVNWLGCALMGALMAWVATNPAHARWLPLLGTGVLGGFTTFSAFGLEAVQLWQRGQGAQALAYVLLSVLGGCMCVLAGMAAARYGLNLTR